MTAAKSDFRKFVDSNQTLPPDVVLGHVTWYTVDDANYDPDKVEQLFTGLGLNPEFLPPPIKSTDAYTKATSEATGHSYPLPGNLTANILVREVTRTTEEIVRHIIREIKDSQNRRLAYDKVGELVFYRPSTRDGKVVKGSERFRASLEPSLSDLERVELEKLNTEVHGRYVRYRDFLDGQKIRGIMRDYLGYLNAVMLKSSVYFVHKSRSDELESLQTFMRSFPSCRMTLLPMPDLKALREEVIEAFQVEAEKELGEVVAQIQKVRSTRAKIRPEMYAKLKEAYSRVANKGTEYTRTLRVTQERTSGAMELAFDALMALEAEMRKQMESA